MVFVEVAREDFPMAGKKQTHSRIAILTGLTRKEVAKLSERLSQKEGPSTANLNRVGRVLAGWHQDPDFTGPYGLPLELHFDAGPNSFSELVRRYSGDMPARALLEELKRVEAVTEPVIDKIRVLTRSYIPEEADPASIQFMGVALRDLAETLDYNLATKKEEGGYFERRVWTPEGISPVDMPRFDTLVNEKGQEFLETLDNWLTTREQDAEKMPPEEKVDVGVGVYLFSDAERKFREK